MYSNLVIGWEGSACLLSRLQLPPGALLLRCSLSGMCLRDLDVVETLPMCLAQSSTVRKCFGFLYYCFFFQEFSVDCRAGRDPMKLSSPFSQPVWGHVHLSNALQTSKAEVPWSLLFTNFLSGRKGFLRSNPHFPYCNCKFITSLFCTCTVDRIKSFQPAVGCCALDPYWAFTFFPYPS